MLQKKYNRIIPKLKQTNIEVKKPELNLEKVKVNEDNIDSKRQNKNRCKFCNKKLKLMNTYNCKCNYSFCEKHRYCHEHNCTVDKSKYKDDIKKNNPSIHFKKLEKIF